MSSIHSIYFLCSSLHVLFVVMSTEIYTNILIDMVMKLIQLKLVHAVVLHYISIILLLKNVDSYCLDKFVQFIRILYMCKVCIF